LPTINLPGAIRKPSAMENTLATSANRVIGALPVQTIDPGQAE
jgi:hypothetical protein